mmetsp:Transcript_8233/g.24254  ORF Transcript_8233/g.24254 Transcript_8233/m.24254 type:complete len:213 (+) Transcript_8233:1319-1957(+)
MHSVTAASVRCNWSLAGGSAESALFSGLLERARAAGSPLLVNMSAWVSINETTSAAALLSIEPSSAMGLVGQTSQGGPAPLAVWKAGAAPRRSAEAQLRSRASSGAGPWTSTKKSTDFSRALAWTDAVFCKCVSAASASVKSSSRWARPSEKEKMWRCRPAADAAFSAKAAQLWHLNAGRSGLDTRKYWPTVTAPATAPLEARWGRSSASSK